MRRNIHFLYDYNIRTFFSILIKNKKASALKSEPYILLLLTIFMCPLQVRQNYIQRRLLITYKTLERLSLSEFNLDKSSGGGADHVPDQLQLPDRNDAAAAAIAAAAGSNKYLSVPRTSKPLCPDDIAVCTDTIKRYQPKAFTRYDRNMFIVNWLDNIDPQNTTVEDPL